MNLANLGGDLTGDFCTSRIERLKTERNRRRLFRCVSRAVAVWGEGVTEKVVWHAVKQFAAKLGVPKVAPHDLRRSCARLCHLDGLSAGFEEGAMFVRAVEPETPPARTGLKVGDRVVAIDGRPLREARGTGRL